MSEIYEICHNCGTKMVRDSQPNILKYKSEETTVDQPGWYCTGCDEVLLTGKDIKATEPAFLELKARVEKLLLPSQVKKVRKELGLSQAKAGKVLGGGPRAFYKYEHGLTLLSRSMHNQLVLLSHDPKRLEELS